MLAIMKTCPTVLMKAVKHRAGRDCPVEVDQHPPPLRIVGSNTIFYADQRSELVVSAHVVVASVASG
ncbi:MAG: hypothetical protein ABJH68_06790 [Ilumatobacter sp.]|uniref:hypothetical protein n=1 Tax=Ilumatobacter sp. TaxID=1967498 RepID=UPI003298E1A9